MKWDFDPAAERFDSPMVEKRPLTFTCTSAPEGDVNESVDPDSCWDCFHSADDPDPAVTILTYEFLETPPDPMCSPAAVCMARMQPVPDVPGTFHACFYGFRVHDLCRGLGIGEAAFCLVLNDLIARGCTRMTIIRHSRSIKKQGSELPKPCPILCIKDMAGASAAKSTPIHELFVYITTILPASDVFPQSSDGCLTSCNLSPR